MTLLRLREAGPASAAPLTAEQARRLAASGVVEVRPGPGADTWLVRADRKVGAARIGDLELRIEPKVEVGRLLFLLGYARNPGAWHEQTLGVPPHPELIPALAATLWRQTERALRGGMLQGYRVVEESSPVLRGRLRESAQLGRRLGLPLPLEIRHDEYTVDIVENRILATAAERMLRVPGVDAESRRMMRHHANRLAEVTRLPPGVPVPAWRPTRLNARYQVALRLAELVLAGSSVDAGVGGVVSNGFLLDMWRVFEGFLASALRRSMEGRHGGAVTTQVTDHLDRGGRIDLRPDIVWRRDGRVVAVVDAKYKAYTPADDAYQMLAYCTVYGLSRGHLVYVIGDHPPIRHAVRNAAIEIVCHALDLSSPPAALVAQVEELADEIAGSTLS
ncbi:McrC family protein [Phytohabitans sp. LJ34]|uniref:McrC family protein n=1 Tax=Phytohabitans sp. LJ34 TaxID=3452217 RepID=UPI003F897FA1